MSGGTDQTRYYVSGLVKNDGGIGVNTGYKKQGVRVNLDQQLSHWLQLSANTNVLHSVSNRGLSNNDNSGTSPYLVFPFTPSFVDLRAPSDISQDQLVAADFPAGQLVVGVGALSVPHLDRRGIHHVLSPMPAR